MEPPGLLPPNNDPGYPNNDVPGGLDGAPFPKRLGLFSVPLFVFPNRPPGFI